ncbi:hypothetical protein AT251_20670 [Enterovibrio nigricans]|uniref:Uncharacterized protein n=1 Tax=Enterovibrio nigricans DSM 22720 TaxID=1121868 RepID=A0A1T4VYQ2_9GAMM|nr:hypothetical protein AT251_20670 [Enterovibrio nigricans]SKA70116.1 hypothetical protein SAMN02745132_04539 [Enterovibrio nigricans DSM 22720]
MKKCATSKRPSLIRLLGRIAVDYHLNTLIWCEKIIGFLIKPQVKKLCIIQMKDWKKLGTERPIRFDSHKIFPILMRGFMSKYFFIPFLVFFISSVMCFQVVATNNPLALEFMATIESIAGHIFGTTLVLALTQ